MYVLKCVKSGNFNFGLSIGTGAFVTEDGDSTRSINRAELFRQKWRATQVRDHVLDTTKGEKGNAVFEVAKVIISLK